MSDECFAHRSYSEGGSALPTVALAKAGMMILKTSGNGGFFMPQCDLRDPATFFSDLLLIGTQFPELL